MNKNDSYFNGNYVFFFPFKYTRLIHIPKSAKGNYEKVEAVYYCKMKSKSTNIYTKT